MNEHNNTTITTTLTV